ncbi:MAG: alpha-L-rhamnosidase N-terminal domain-containing protein [Anaerolineae bacterium]|jgi:alpha-L-rhamnosidase|nr:alpha-L-rhamnosidase N-terminal domain-containing protein [Anaerolineae bacterium]
MLRLPHSPFLYRQVQSHPAPYLRREFDLRTGIVSARLYLTALGVVEASLNGQCVGEQVLTPGWTAYD